MDELKEQLEAVQERIAGMLTDPTISWPFNTTSAETMVNSWNFDDLCSQRDSLHREIHNPDHVHDILVRWDDD